MDQPPGFVLKGEKNKVCRFSMGLINILELGLNDLVIPCLVWDTNKLILTILCLGEKVCVLIVYVGDIIVTGDDVDKINRLKENWKCSFELVG